MVVEAGAMRMCAVNQQQVIRVQSGRGGNVIISINRLFKV